MTRLVHAGGVNAGMVESNVPHAPSRMSRCNAGMLTALGERFQVRPRRSIESDDEHAGDRRDGLCCRSHGRVV